MPWESPGQATISFVRLLFAVVLPLVGCSLNDPVGLGLDLEGGREDVPEEGQAR